MEAILETFNRGHYGAAEVQLRELTQRYPRHGFGWKLLGPALSLQGRNAEALAAFQTAVELMPMDAEAHSNLGKALADAGRLGDAEACHRRAVELEPELALAHNNLGTALADQGRPAEAAACYRRALELQPDMAVAHNNLGNALRDQGWIAEAEESYRNALILSPGYSEAHNNLGAVLAAQSRPTEAEACYRRALELQPNVAMTHNYLGIALADQSRFSEAEASYRRALELKPDYAEAHNNLGTALRDQGRLAEAEACFRRALEFMPTSVEANINLSAVLTQLVPLWHIPMMNDAMRNEAYVEALRAAVTPASNVLEIGTGSGLLAMIAARFGARQVVTCEAVPLIAATARDIVAANGLQSSVSVISKMSTDITVGVDLPQRANLMVSEILSSELLGEGVLSSIEDAKRRLIEPGAKIIPAVGSIVFALFGGEGIAKHARVDDVLGFDLKAFNAISASRRIVYRGDLGIELLTDTAEAFAFDFVRHDYFPAARKTLSVPIKVAGLCYGIAQWIRLEMDDTITFENHPSIKTPASGWQTCLYSFPTPVHVMPGQTAMICAAHNRSAVWFFWEGLKERAQQFERSEVPDRR
jgi:tetratricopeptide (TPR) repeat protein